VGREVRSENALVFMAKWPTPGSAKTRLCPPLSTVEAADLARAFLLDMLAEARRAADPWIAYAPGSAAAEFRSLVGAGVGLVDAAAPDLGAALRRAQSATLARGYRRVALVAADIPHLPVWRYAEAFAALERADVVIGPSGDGGYYLLASARETPALFEGVTWSTAAVYGQTVQRAAAAGLTVATLARCDDIDTGADLRWLLVLLRARPGAGHTHGLLEQLAGRHPGIGMAEWRARVSHGERT
jgi:rSAM/selenodomain-associated transferase 1